MLMNDRKNIAFLFDMDGTLIDSMPFHNRSWLEVLSMFQIQLTVDELEKYNRGTITEVISRILHDFHSDADVEEIAMKKEALFRKIYRPHIHCIEGLRSFLSQSRTLGIRAALVTSAQRQNIDFVLDSLTIRSYFDVVIGDEEVVRGKPDPQAYLLAAEQLGIAPSNCIVFEDAPSGIEAARRAGMKCIVIATSLDEPAVTNLPTVIHTIRDYTRLNPEILLNKVY